MMRLAVVAALCAWTGTAVLAQEPERTPPALQAVLLPGTTVWITDASSNEEQVRIISVSGGVVTAAAGQNIRRVRAADIMRVRARRSDSVLNGALIGAGAAIASGLFLCSLTETFDNCRDDVGPMLRIGALGAGIGIGIDALIRGRKTIYESGAGTKLDAAPMIGRRAGGLQISLYF